MPDIVNGFQPDTRSSSSRRADFDLLRRISKLERSGGGTEPPIGGGTDEVWIGPTAPTDPGVELWYDTDAVADYGGTPVVAVPYASWPPVSPEPDTLYLRLAP